MAVTALWPEAAVSLSRKQHQVLSCIANQMTTEDILEKLKISLKTFYCHKHNIMMILNLKRINELVRHQHIDYLVWNFRLTVSLATLPHRLAN
ncbi:transcriptional regulator [Escherichia coli]|nr:transcriptional regulator [Escherichia coli]